MFMLGDSTTAYTLSLGSHKLIVLSSVGHRLTQVAAGCLACCRRGPGVVGEQPLLEPGKSFEYQSACPLFTTVGTMEGEYEMIVMDSQGNGGDKIEVKIGKFALRKPEQS